MAATRASVNTVGIVKPDAEFVNPYLAASPSSLPLLFVLVVFLVVAVFPLLVGLSARMVSNSPAAKTSDANCALRVLVILEDAMLLALALLDGSVVFQAPPPPPPKRLTRCVFGENLCSLRDDFETSTTLRRERRAAAPDGDHDANKNDFLENDDVVGVGVARKVGRRLVASVNMYVRKPSRARSWV